MLVIIKNNTYFTFLFALLLGLDIYVKLNLPEVPYRLLTKPLVMLSIIAFYLVNNNEKSRKKFKFMLLALIAYLLGDLFLVFYNYTVLYIIGLILFIVGKLFYASRFSNQNDFNLTKLVPFLIACFLYMIFIMFFVLNNLKSFFVPTMLYLFASMIVALFAILRKGNVSKRSFNFVLIGIFFAVLCDSISIFQSFYNENIPYHKITIMLTYGISQYFIVRGVVEETNPLTA